ncbi:hypothetical protein K9M79_02740 [Candidatus Woesearchaeota archaeon]|nr:hypothetical protein [Candidatus Woesearchaeota archaeon]
MRSNKKGFMEGLNMLVSVVIIALAFMIFSGYALMFGIPKTEFNVNDVNILQDAVFIENYLNTPISDNSDDTIYDEIIMFYVKGDDQALRSKTNEILAMMGLNPNYRILVGEGDSQREILTSGFNQKKLVMDESTLMPNPYYTSPNPLYTSLYTDGAVKLRIIISE